jgi:hypothetical protein
MTLTNEVELLRGANPVPFEAARRYQGNRLVAQQIIDNSKARNQSENPKKTRRLLAPVSAFGLLAASTIVFTAFPRTPSVAAEIRAAVSNPALRSGAAHVVVTATVNEKNNDGTAELLWNGPRESYVFDQPNQLQPRVEIRLIEGEQFLRTGSNWSRSGAEAKASATVNGGGGSGVLAEANPFAPLSDSVTFEKVGADTIDGRSVDLFRATQGLKSIDDNPKGFIFGCNGAPGCETKQLELWIDGDNQIRRVRTQISGRNDGFTIRATWTADLTRLGEDILIDRPSVG